MSRVRRLLLASLAALLALASCGREKHETAARTTEARKAAPAFSGPVSPTAALDKTIEALAGAEPRETLEDLATLRAGLEAAGDAAAADAIARFLRSGRDAPRPRPAADNCSIVPDEVRSSEIGGRQPLG